MTDVRALLGWYRFRMDGLAVIYIVVNAAAAQYSGGTYLLFPGLVALSHDTLTVTGGVGRCWPGPG